MVISSLNCDVSFLWLTRQNQYSRPECRNLYSQKCYQQDIECKELLDGLIDFCIQELMEEKLTTGLVALSGAQNQLHFWKKGSTGEQCNVDENTIFDLASVTKIFLCICYQILVEQEKVDLSLPLHHYCGTLFSKIGHLTLDELMHFSYTLRTPSRLEDCSFEHAVQMIEQVEVISNVPCYSDIPAIVLGMVFQKISSVSFGQFFQQQFIDALKLKRTFWRKPEMWDDNRMVYDNEYRFLNGHLNCLHTAPFEVNDRKARSLSSHGTLLCGHAGIFSSACDIAKISKALLNEQIISIDALCNIGNISHRAVKSNYFGALCYTKNPSRRDTEIFWGMGGNSFAISGYTGVYYMVDPLNRKFCFIGGNRIYERLTQCDSLDFLRTARIPYTQNFVYERDRLQDLLCKYALTHLDPPCMMK